jgi:hypothetical protein
MKNKIYLVMLVGIFILGLSIRLYHLDQNRPNLYTDEAGGNYYTWVDLNNPQISWIYKVYPLAMSYAWFLGLTPLAARLPSAFYGSLIPIFIYFLARSIVHQKSVRLTAAFLGAIVPWSFMISRISFAQIPIVICLVCLHFILFIGAKNIRRHLISLVPLLIATFLYPSMIIISLLPICLVGYQIFRLASPRQKSFASLVLIATSFAVGVSFFGVYKGFSLGSRGIDMAIWRDVNVTADSNLYRGLSRLSQPTIFSFGQKTETVANRILYNYPLSVLGVFTKNYLSFFSPDFLFIKGDTTLRQSTGMVGSFFVILAPFLIFGAFSLWNSNVQAKTKIAFLIWILISPIPGAITKDGPGYLLRVVTMMPFLTYLSALGIVEAVKVVDRRWSVDDGLRGKKLPLLSTIVHSLPSIVIFGAITFSTYSFLFGYFHVYPALAASHFEYGFKELSDFQVTHRSLPMLVVWDGYYPQRQFRFWQQTPASEYSSFTPKSIEVGASVVYQTFPNLYFSLPKTVEDLRQFIAGSKVPYLVLPADFLVRNPEYKRPDKEMVDVIKYPDGSTAFVIYNVN